MCSRKRLTFIKDFINNESVCHFMVVQLFKLSTKDISIVIRSCCNLSMFKVFLLKISFLYFKENTGKMHADK